VLGRAVEEACQRSFPRAAGYVISRAGLAGMIEGVRVSIRKGSFVAVVSAQAVLEAEEQAGRGRGCAIRLVAAARHDAGGSQWRAAARTTLIAAAATAVFVATAALLSSYGFWGYFRLALLMSFLIMMTPAVAWLTALRREAALTSAGQNDLADWPALLPAEDLERWQALLGRVGDPAALLAEEGDPFRGRA
jgi:hypothetical protein